MDPARAQSFEAVAEARRKFCAVLAPWASELLELRRRGLDRPSFRLNHGQGLRPAALPALAAPGRERRAA